MLGTLVAGSPAIFRWRRWPNSLVGLGGRVHRSVQCFVRCDFSSKAWSVAVSTNVDCWPNHGGHRARILWSAGVSQVSIDAQPRHGRCFGACRRRFGPKKIDSGRHQKDETAIGKTENSDWHPFVAFVPANGYLNVKNAVNQNASQSQP